MIDEICSFSQRTWLLRLRLLHHKTYLPRLPHPRTRPFLLLHPKTHPPKLLHLKNPRPDRRDLGNQHLNYLRLINRCPSHSSLIRHCLCRSLPLKPRLYLIYLRVSRFPSLILRCPMLQSIHLQIFQTLIQIWHCSLRRSVFTNCHPKSRPFHKFKHRLRSLLRALTSSSRPNLSWTHPSLP